MQFLTDLTKFRSSKEKKYWLYALIVLFAIFASIFIGRLLLNILSQDTVSTGFWIGMILVLITAMLNGLKTIQHPFEILTYTGIVAVYLIIILRMASPEHRSHMIEYTVLAIFVLEALKERALHKKLWLHPALLTIIICTLIGALDECLQLFVPGRIFDWFDILFNFIASILAVAAAVILTWIRKQVSNKLTN